MKILFERRLCRQRETVLSSPFYPLTATWRAKKRHGFSKNLSTKLPKPAPLKKRHLFFASLLRWSAVADSGMVPAALPSTPVPQHPKPKRKHRIEIFFEKPSIPVPQHRAENFQHQLQKCCECHSLSYRNIGGQKTTSIFESSQKIHKLVGSHGPKRKKSACLFSEADALLVLFSFYFISRISSSFTSSVGLPPASSLFRKANIAAVNSRRSSARSTTTRSPFLRPNMAAPQQ